jgi:hypothetical protein
MEKQKVKIILEKSPDKTNTDFWTNPRNTMLQKCNKTITNKNVTMQKEHFQSLYTGTVDPGHISIVFVL